MTKLELTVSTSTWECVTYSDESAAILGMNSRNPHVSTLLANDEEFDALHAAVKDLVAHQKVSDEDKSDCHFQTLNLVFSAPNAPSNQNRSQLEGVFRSPIKAMHWAGELHLACFASIELSEDGTLLHISALEYSRKHRQRFLQQEFGAWLLDDHIEKAVIATTLTGEVVFWNHFCTELYQYTREEAMNKNIMELTPSDMTQQQGIEIMAKLANGEHWTGMFRVHRKDGTNFVAHVTDTPILDVDGNVKFIVGVSADYSHLDDIMRQLKTLNAGLESEVQLRTQQLLEREQNLRMVGAAIQESDAGVVFTDKSHRIVWSNDAVVRMLGLTSQEQVLGALPWELPLQHEHQDAASSGGNLNLRGFLEQTTPESVATTATVTHASPVDVLSVAYQRMQFSEGGDKYSCMITLRDLTAQRKADKAQREAESLAAENDTKTEMMQMLTHELRTPLQGIMGVTSTLLEDMAPEEGIMFDSLSTILASSRLLLTLINNTLDVRKINSNMMQEIELSSVPILSCIADSQQFCQPFASSNEVRISVLENNVASRNWNVLANRLRLEQVMVNLLSNAIKYTTPGTDVVISVRQCAIRDALAEARTALSSDLNFMESEVLNDSDSSKNVTVVTVRDHGGGIPEDEADKVFEEFVQLRVSSDKDRKYKGGKASGRGQSSGSGLGMNLAMKFINRMNGHIWCNNCGTAGGAKFSFFLPSCADTDRDMFRRELSSLSIELLPESASRFRVLLVDDSMINLKVLKRMFLRLGVKHVVTSFSGDRALEYLTSSDSNPLPNLILCDLQMPGMDGYELLAHIREMDMQPSPIISSCSADWNTETEAKCLRLGFDHTLRKPITLSDLKEFLAATQVPE